MTKVDSPKNSEVLSSAIDHRTWRELRIESECRDDAGSLRGAVFYGSGVGIWNRERQFEVPRETLLSLLAEIQRSEFLSLPESHGGKNDPAPQESARLGLEMICRVRLVLDDLDRQSFQLSEGRQSAELKALAEKLIAVGAARGPKGVGASSLEEGLDLLARGELAPEALTFQFHRQPEDPKVLLGGWILRIEHGKAQLSRMSKIDGWTTPQRFPFSSMEVGFLALHLASARLGELPSNLYSTWYQDLEVRVLNHRKTLQARRFSGVDETTHGERQERYDQLVSAIEALAQRAPEAE